MILARPEMSSDGENKEVSQAILENQLDHQLLEKKRGRQSQCLRGGVFHRLRSEFLPAHHHSLLLEPNDVS